MWTSPVTTTPPTGEVVTLADAQAHCEAPDDPAIAGYLAAAVAHIEAITGTRLLTQTVRLRRRNFCNEMPLPIGPVQSATITYLDSAGATQTLDPAVYTVTGAGTLGAGIALLPGKSWPAIQAHPEAVTVSAVVGYGAASAVPAPIRQSILLLVGDWYMNREDTMAERSVTPLPVMNGVSATLANYRLF